MKPSLILPPKSYQGAQVSIQSENNVVIIGANGAGKTRLGVWIEQTMQDRVPVHRISAQKALNIPDFAQLRNIEQAEKELVFGRSDEFANNYYKNTSRWGNDPVTFVLNDFEKLISLLFAKSAERDRIHTAHTRASQSYIPVPSAPIDIIIQIWSDLMPHRQIAFLNSKVLTNKTGEQTYHGKDMSDGERVTLYLIGQCLCAPENSIIIIDEPELHLHKSLMSRLWNKIEELCPNKRLVFITHDLDFATSRKEAIKIWIRSYDGTNAWVWDEVPVIDALPENLVVEIIGNRKNIIFCEGEKTSYDTTLYQAIYPNYYVVGRGGCEKVIESTKAMRSSMALHHLTCFGIIDSDYRVQEEIDALRNTGIFTINVAEVENLFCIEGIIRIVADNQHLKSNDVVNAVTSFVIKSSTLR